MKNPIPRDKWRLRAIEGVQSGDVFAFSRTFTEEEVAAFGDATGDRNPVHCDAVFAASKGFHATVCHGLLAGSMITEVGGQLGFLATGMEFFFLKPVYPDEPVKCTVVMESVSEKRFAHATARLENKAGELLMKITLKGFLPDGKERERMAETLKS